MWEIRDLERIRARIAWIKTALELDPEGVEDIKRALDELEFEVDKELKNLLWLDSPILDAVQECYGQGG